MKDFEQFMQQQFAKKPGLKVAYDALGPHYELASQIIALRLKKGLSQAQLAEKMGTKQSSIARLESGNYNPSIGLLAKVAKATGTRLNVRLES